MLNTNTNNFNWRNNNLSVYKPFNHQHLDEIYQTLNSMSNKSKVYFIPYRGNFTRGIFTSIYLECEESFETVRNIYEEFYRDHPFTFLSKNDINLKEVVNTNNCHISICQTKFKDKVIILCAIDNLIKGGAGQAIQNMNLKFDLKQIFQKLNEQISVE